MTTEFNLPNDIAFSPPIIHELAADCFRSFVDYLKQNSGGKAEI